MKKIISVTLLLLLCMGLTLTAFANDRDFTVSEDYKTITLDGVNYIRTQTTGIIFYETEELLREPTLTEEQSTELTSYTFTTDSRQISIEACFYFRDGAELSCGYIREDYLEEYREMTTGDTMTYTVDFYWPTENTVDVTIPRLKGTPTTLTGSTLYWGSSYDVSLDLGNGSCYVQRGLLIVDNNSFYYLDYSENPQMSHGSYFGDISEFSQLKGYEVTDSLLLEQLREAEERSNSANVFMDRDGFGVTLSAVMMSLLFGLIPLAILTLALILTLRSKGCYRPIWGTTAALAGATLLIYIGFVIQILNL